MTGPILIHNSGDSLDTVLAYSDGVGILSTAFNSETPYRGIQFGEILLQSLPLMIMVKIGYNMFLELSLDRYCRQFILDQDENM